MHFLTSSRLPANLSIAIASLMTYAWLALTALSAQAGPFELYGAGSQGAAVAGAQGAIVDDPTAVFSNPARLTLVEDSQLTVGLQSLLPSLSIDRAEGSPTNIDGGRSNVFPDPTFGATVGAAWRLGEPWGAPMSLGVLAFIPFPETTRLEAVDPISPHFTAHQPLTDGLHLSAALAIEPWPGWRLGLGAMASVALTGQADALLDAEQRTILRSRLEAEIQSDLAPIIALNWNPWPSWSFGLTWRGAQALNYDLPIKFILVDGGELNFFIGGQTLYTPHTVSAATAWSAGPWQVALELTWSHWSAAPSPAADVTSNLNDAGFDPDDPEVTRLLDLASITLAPGFVDTLTPRLAVVRRLNERWSVRGGYALRPTHIPEQVGTSNMLDSTMHQVGLGVGISFPTLPLRVDVFAQLNHYAQRRHSKDSARDLLAIGDVSAGGQIWHQGFSITW